MLLYRLATAAYHGSIRIAALAGNQKAQAWVSGRKEAAPPFRWEDQTKHQSTSRITPPDLPAREELSDKLAGTKQANLNPTTGPIRKPSQKLVWMHVASLGEFEQGRPVLDLIRRDFPDYFILLTFYSPSGYQRSQNYAGADSIRYLPADTPTNARNWIAEVQPDLAIFVKYDFWRFHLRELKRNEVPTVLIAGAFRPSQWFFKRYDFGARQVLSYFDHFVVQYPRHQKLLATEVEPERITIGGDPRADRVLQLAAAGFTNPIIEEFCGDAPVFIVGSAWAKDLEVLKPLLTTLPQHWKIIIAPHELKETEIRQWNVDWDGVRYTKYESAKDLNKRVLFLDTIGLLSRIYRFGKIAYIGGGFGSGIHNTLEPMAYGLPVIFGLKFDKFPEAVITAEEGGSFSVSSANELRLVVEKLLDEESYAVAQGKIEAFTSTAAGAAGRTYGVMRRFL